MTAPATLTLPAPAAPADPMAGTLTFIGNATLLLRYAGFTILTDPTFIHKHEQTCLGWGMHTTRLTDPAMEIADLPPLDFILLSHFHGDHFDQAAEAGLDHALPIVTTPQAAPELARRGFINTWSIDTWRSLEIVKGDARLRVTATPGRHGPPLSDLALPEVMGSVLDCFVPADVHRFRSYITGDTLIFDDLRELPRRFPDIDLALLHLGGTRVLGLLLTMDAAQGGRNAAPGRSGDGNPKPLRRLRCLHLAAVRFPARGRCVRADDSRAVSRARRNVRVPDRRSAIVCRSLGGAADRRSGADRDGAGGTVAGRVMLPVRVDARPADSSRVDFLAVAPAFACR